MSATPANPVWEVTGPAVPTPISDEAVAALVRLLMARVDRDDQQNQEHHHHDPRETTLAKDREMASKAANQG